MHTPKTCIQKYQGLFKKKKKVGADYQKLQFNN